MTVLVTGATGFLGAALVTELVGQGSSVRVLARDRGKARRKLGDAVTIIEGSITEAGPVGRAVDGANTVYHLAGQLYHPSRPPVLYHRTHVEGTRVLLEACLKHAGLERLVHVSTTGVHGVTGDELATEEAAFAPTNPYESSKLEGERLAMAAHLGQGLPVTVVRPGLVYGAGDLHLLGLFAAIDRGWFRVIDGGRALLHPVYLADVVAALVRCAQVPLSVGCAYNVAGPRPVSVRELAAAIAGALHRRLPGGSIPRPLANLAADVFAMVPFTRGERAPLTRARVEFLTKSRIYDIGRAKAELGWAPHVGLEEGMQRTVTWYCQHGYLPQAPASGRRR